MPTTIAEAEALREWALTTRGQPTTPATEEQLARHLEFLASALPSRANDADTGRKRTAVYTAMIRGWSNETLAFMARTACQTLDWFPSPKQCLEILATYRAPEPPQAAALLACDRFMADAYERWLANVKAGQQLGDVPERWLRMAVEDGCVRRMDGGTYVSRALYHGPPRQPYRAPPPEPFRMPTSGAAPDIAAPAAEPQPEPAIEEAA